MRYFTCVLFQMSPSGDESLAHEYMKLALEQVFSLKFKLNDYVPLAKTETMLESGGTCCAPF